MTAKRFEWVDGIDYENMSFKDNLLNKEISSVEDLIKWLNELHEENQALKSDRARYEEECRLDVFKELSEENEQIKQTIKESIRTERTDMGRNVLKQLWEAIR